MWLGLSGPYAHSTYLSPNMTAGDLTVAMEIAPLLPARPPPPSAWKCPRLLIWDHTCPPPSPRVNKSTFVLFCPVSNGVYCKWKMARGALGCLSALSSALQLENFLERAPVSWLKRWRQEKKKNGWRHSLQSYFQISTIKVPFFRNFNAIHVQ